MKENVRSILQRGKEREKECNETVKIGNLAAKPEISFQTFTKIYETRNLSNTNFLNFDNTKKSQGSREDQPKSECNWR